MKRLIDRLEEANTVQVQKRSAVEKIGIARKAVEQLELLDFADNQKMTQEVLALLGKIQDRAVRYYEGRL